MSHWDENRRITQKGFWTPQGPGQGLLYFQKIWVPNLGTVSDTASMLQNVKSDKLFFNLTTAYLKFENKTF